MKPSKNVSPDLELIKSRIEKVQNAQRFAKENDVKVTPITLLPQSKSIICYPDGTIICEKEDCYLYSGDNPVDAVKEFYKSK